MIAIGQKCSPTQSLRKEGLSAMKRPDLLLDDVYHSHRLKPGPRSGVGGPHQKGKISDEIHFPPVNPMAHWMQMNP